MSTANTMLHITMPGVIANANAISLKLWVWPVPVEKPFIGNASRHPRAPPSAARNTDSSTNDEQDRAAREAQGAQRPDLAGPRRDHGVHRVHGAEHGADAHDERDAPREVAAGSLARAPAWSS